MSSERVPSAAWSPGNAQRCQGCGESVTQAFRRVFGTNRDRVYACPACASMNQIKDGAPADPEYDVETDRAEMRHAGIRTIGGGER